MSDAVVGRPVVRSTGERRSDQLVVEEPMEIRLDGTALAVVMRTPGDDAELALGFALTEGIVTDPGDVVDVNDLGEGRWDLVTGEGIVVDPTRFQRNFYSTSSCGVCGKASIDAIRIAGARPPDGPVITATAIGELPSLLRGRQAAFDVTGGLHAAAAFTEDGRLIVAREDIGRHNAVDKVIGHLARHRWPFPPLGLMVSGRVSFEITQKAAVVGISLVCGVSAASSLAVELAEEFGMTVVGFVRDGGFTVYTGERRIAGLG